MPEQSNVLEKNFAYLLLFTQQFGFEHPFSREFSLSTLTWVRSWPEFFLHASVTASGTSLGHYSLTL